MKKLIACSLFLSILLIACQDFNKSDNKDQSIPTLPEITYDYLAIESSNPIRPALSLVNNLKSKGVENDIVTLGRVLFYDKKLSISNRISCGSCHKQNLGFSDGKQFSEGFKNDLTTRNSMSIANGLISNNFFWDSRTTDLSTLVLEPIQNHIEMGLEDLEYLNEKLRKVEYYPELFQAAFGDEAIITDRISIALEQFLLSMVSFNSDFDKEAFNGLQETGLHLFEENCATCHRDPSISFQWGSSSRNANIGLDLIYEDKGVGSWSLASGHEGIFRAPSLRNINMTAPYMHDGRFSTLEDVINHYSEGIKNHPNLDWQLQDHSIPGQTSARRMNFSEEEKLALKALMETFTDEKFVTDERYSDPFQ